MRALFNGEVIAESDDTVVVEGNHYFPDAVVADTHVRPSDTTTECGWKGTAHYKDVVVNGVVAKDAMWYYPEPFAAAEEIRGRVAFWHEVVVEPTPSLADKT
jgi:uncharacterized protein (DUF427 family)